MSTYAPFAKPLYVMLKPVGAVCNLACDYCYYLEKSKLYRDNPKHVMSEELLEKFIEEYINSQTMPQVNVGDTVKVHVKVKEGSRERIQVFEGTVIAKKHGGIEETITVRRLSYGVGVEKVFPVHSPSIEKIETVRSGFVRRAKLYYLRDRVGKAAKVREKL